jgi:C-terminal processing protease CtpA/Prc
MDRASSSRRRIHGPGVLDAQCRTPARESQLHTERRHHRWSDRRKALTEELSMDEVIYQRTLDQVLGESQDKDALIVDVRFNRGGLLHEELRKSSDSSNSASRNEPPS